MLSPPRLPPSLPLPPSLSLFARVLLVRPTSSRPSSSRPSRARLVCVLCVRGRSRLGPPLERRAGALLSLPPSRRSLSLSLSLSLSRAHALARWPIPGRHRAAAEPSSCTTTVRFPLLAVDMPTPTRRRRPAAAALALLVAAALCHAPLRGTASPAPECPVCPSCPGGAPEGDGDAPRKVVRVPTATFIANFIEVRAGALRPLPPGGARTPEERTLPDSRGAHARSRGCRNTTS